MNEMTGSPGTVLCMQVEKKALFCLKLQLRSRVHQNIYIYLRYTKVTWVLQKLSQFS